MKKRLLLFFLILPCFLFIHSKSRADDNVLSPRHKKWLEENVVYIAAPVEKEVFFKLETDRERDLFIDSFWKHRDPTPGTPENEFKTEHSRRISHVNHFFGRATPKPGWRTDRGRIYIILGEPTSIESFAGTSTTYSSEAWFYQDKIDLKLPPGFYVVFFQEGGLGEYRLYSPTQDGPQALMPAYFGDRTDYMAAYQKLRESEPALASLSLSLIPGEGSLRYGRPSLSSDILIQKIESSHLNQVNDIYAKKFLEYKDIVEVEYTANYMDSDSLLKVIKEPSGVYFVHYAIDPERLSVNEYKGKYSTNLKLNGTVKDSDGNNIYQFERNIDLDLDQAQIKNASHRPFSIHDMFPLVPGNYTLSILLKNEVSREFTSMERTLLIPQEKESFQMTSLLLGYKVNKKKTNGDRLKPFRFGDNQVYFQSNRIFLRQDDLIVAFQIHDLSQAMREKGEIRYTFFRMDEEFRSITKKIDEYPERPNFIQTFPLQNFQPAHYRIQVTLMADDKDVITNREDFAVTYSDTIARPWIYSKLLPSSENPVYAFTLGKQLFNSGKIEESKAFLEEAFWKRPDSIDFALNLALVYMRLAEHENIESVLLPFLNRPEIPQYEVFLIVGKTYQKMGRLDKAIEVFDKTISHYGLNMILLNALGECYANLGNKEKALAAWEESLEINPNQPQIKKNVKALKDKK